MNPNMLIYKRPSSLMLALLLLAIPLLTHAMGTNPLDTLPPYDGLRVHLVNVELVKVKNERAKIKYDVVNTGRLPVRSTTSSRLPKSLVIEFEDALKNCQCQLMDFQDAIRYQFYYEKLNLSPGKTSKNRTMDFAITNVAPPAMVMYKPREATTPKVKKEKPKAQPTTPKREATERIATAPESTPAPAVEKTETAAVLKVEKDLPETFVKSETPTLVEETQPTEKPEVIVEVAPAPAVEVTKPAVKKEPVELAVQEETPEIIADQSSEKAGVSKKTATTVPSVNRMIEPVVSKEAKEEGPASEELAEAIKEEVILSDESPEKKLKKRKCSDLVISDIKILKQNKSQAVIEFTLTNYGEAAAKIASQSNDTGQIFAIKAFLSRSGQLSRGSLPVGGTFVNKVPNRKDGKLRPNASYTGTIKVDIRKKTRFTPNVVLSIDPYLSLLECDRSNNTNFVNLEKGE